MTDLSDDQLLARAQKLDEAALTQLYRRYRERVYGMAWQLCGNTEDAQEVMQDVFRYFFDQFPGLQLNCQVFTYLYPIIRNKSIDLIRRRRGQAVALEANHAAVEDRRLIPDLYDAVAELPEEYRDVLLLRLVQGASLKEIAEQLRIPEGTVKSRLHNGLDKIRKFF